VPSPTTCSHAPRPVEIPACCASHRREALEQLVTELANATARAVISWHRNSDATLYEAGENARRYYGAVLRDMTDAIEFGADWATEVEAAR
jgi:hypothetical protein